MATLQLGSSQRKGWGSNFAAFESFTLLTPMYSPIQVSEPQHLVRLLLSAPVSFPVSVVKHSDEAAEGRQGLFQGHSWQSLLLPCSVHKPGCQIIRASKVEVSEMWKSESGQAGNGARAEISKEETRLPVPSAWLETLIHEVVLHLAVVRFHFSPVWCRHLSQRKNPLKRS